MIDLPADKKLILFDGVCHLCNNSVNLIIKHDKKEVFLFVPLQSGLAQDIMTYLGIDSSQINSIILYEPRVSYDVKSSAALKIMNDLGGWWKLTQLLWIIPRYIRDIVYDVVANNRYKWFGKEQNCMVPTPELQKKFLG